MKPVGRGLRNGGQATADSDYKLRDIHRPVAGTPPGAAVRPAEPGETLPAPEQSFLYEASYVEKALGLVLLLLLLVGCALILQPFLTAILLAVILCVSTWSVYRRIAGLFRGRQTAAALTTTVTAAGLLVLPLLLLGANMADDIVRLNAAVQLAIQQGLPPPDWLSRVPIVGDQAEQVWVQASQQGVGLGTALAPYLEPLRDWALRHAASLLSGTLQVVFALVIAFFLYRDGAHVESRLEWAFARLGGWRARRVLSTAGLTIVSVVNGVLGTALIQGILLGFSFWLAGVPGAMVLGALAVVFSLVPMGLLLLWLPAALWLMSQGHTGWALFVLAWNALFVGNLDNILRPYLISRGIRMPMVLIFLGVLGGLVTFGIVGVFLGPVLLATAYTLFQDWGRPSETAPAPSPV